MIADRTFGKRARDARELDGMSQAEVIEALAALNLKHPMSLRTLQRVEAGKSLGAKWVKQLKLLFSQLR